MEAGVLATLAARWLLQWAFKVAAGDPQTCQTGREILAGNERLRQDIARYRLLVRALCRITGTLENLRAALVEHQEILGFISQRDSQRAGDAMRRHNHLRRSAVLQTGYGEAL